MADGTTLKGCPLTDCAVSHFQDIAQGVHGEVIISALSQRRFNQPQQPAHQVLAADGTSVTGVDLVSGKPMLGSLPEGNVQSFRKILVGRCPGFQCRIHDRPGQYGNEN